MSKTAVSIKAQVQRKHRLYGAMRRADIVMQIREKMAAKAIKSIDLAERIGVSEANVSRWLNGKQNLQLDTLYLLADALEEPLTLQIGDPDPLPMPNMDFVSNGCSEWRVSDATTWAKVIDMQIYKKTRLTPSYLEKECLTGELTSIFFFGDSDEHAEASA